MVREFISAHIGLGYELGGVFLLFIAVVMIASMLISRFGRVPLLGEFRKRRQNKLRNREVR